MARLPAQWSTQSSSVSPASGRLLLETGSYLLLETGGFIALEGISITPKEASRWDNNTSKQPASWAVNGSGTLAPSNANVQRKEIDGTVRIEQDGTIRVLQETAFSPKSPAQWDLL